MPRAFTLVALLACTSADTDPGETRDTDSDADTDADTDSDADADADTDAPDTDVDTCALQPTCVVGHGREGFMPVDPSSQIVMVHGPQGGWHIDLAVQVEHTTPIVRVLPTIRHVPSAALLAGDDGLFDTFNLALTNTGECAGEAWQLTTFLDEVEGLDLAVVCGLAGGALELELTVTTEDQRTATCAATGIAALDPIDVGPCASLP